MADLMNPDRIVIGAQSEHAIDLMKKVYEPFMAPILVTDINSAELIKHAANSFLALKISYINAVSAICEASGADVEKVADGIGMDRRIGRNFLNAGIGYGGSCFPKDIAAFITISEQLGVPFNLLKEVQRINATQKDRFLKAIREALWVLRDKKIAVWGLTFKPDTDDIRSSVAIELVADMLTRGRARHRLRSERDGEGARSRGDRGRQASRAPRWKRWKAPRRSIVATEWAEFANVDLATVKEKMAHADHLRRAQSFSIRETMAQARLSLPFHRPAADRSGLTTKRSVSCLMAPQSARSSRSRRSTNGAVAPSLPIRLSPRAFRRSFTRLLRSRLRHRACSTASCAT